MASTHSVSSDFVKQLNGYGLTTAEILYRRPDRKARPPASLPMR